MMLPWNYFAYNMSTMLSTGATGKTMMYTQSQQWQRWIFFILYSRTWNSLISMETHTCHAPGTRPAHDYVWFHNVVFFIRSIFTWRDCLSPKRLFQMEAILHCWIGTQKIDKKVIVCSSSIYLFMNVTISVLAIEGNLNSWQVRLSEIQKWFILITFFAINTFLKLNSFFLLTCLIIQPYFKKPCGCHIQGNKKV